MLKTILQRTYVLYLLAIIILLNVTDLEHVHVQRLSELDKQNKYFSGENVNVAINFWNYYKRLDPKNISTLENLSRYYLLAQDNSQAKENLNSALCIAPPNFKDRPKLLKAYTFITGTDKIYCKDKISGKISLGGLF